MAREATYDDFAPGKFILTREGPARILKWKRHQLGGVRVISYTEPHDPGARPIIGNFRVTDLSEWEVVFNPEIELEAVRRVKHTYQLPQDDEWLLIKAELEGKPDSTHVCSVCGRTCPVTT